MRVAAVGASLLTCDEKILVHRRDLNATHCGGMLDSSCAGLCQIYDGKLDPRRSLYEKLERELSLKSEDIELIGLSGIHSAYSPDFSNMFDFKLRTDLTSEEVAERIKKNFKDFTFVPKEAIGEFIINHYQCQE